MIPAEVAPWTWRWGPPGGQASEVTFGDNLPFDIIRLALVISSIVLLWLSGRCIIEQNRRRNAMSRAQSARFLALAIAAVSLGTTEAWVMGTTATPRLFINLAAIGIGLWGVSGKRSRQLTEPLA